MYGAEVHYTRELAAVGLVPSKHRFTVSVDPRAAYLRCITIQLCAPAFAEMIPRKH